jgi:peptidyl-prolyl cis-trans isomerase SurA
MKNFFSLASIGILLAVTVHAVDMPGADYAPPLEKIKDEPTMPPCHSHGLKEAEKVHHSGSHKNPKGKVDESVHIAAVVNHRIITTKDLDERVKMLIKGNIAEIPAPELKKARHDVLRQLIDEKLQLEITENAKIFITDEDVKNALRYMEEQNHLESGSIEKDLKGKGVSDKTVKDYFGARVAWSRLIGYYRDTIDVGKKDLAEQAKEKDLKEKQYLLAELVFGFQSMMDEENARHEAMQALGRVKQGEHFSQVAHEMSHAPSAASGGDIGWIQESHCEVPVRQALRFMKAGELSEPIRTEDGYKIVLLRNIMHPHKQTDTLTARQLEIKLAAHLSQTEKEEEKSRFDGLFETIEGCEQFDKVGEQLESELHIYKDVSLPDLSEDLQTVLKDLPVGKPSTGYITDNSVVYLMVCHRALATVQPINAEEKTDAIVSQRLGAFAEQKLRDIRRVAAIDIRI